jgi:Fe-S-cluster containining protein
VLDAGELGPWLRVMRGAVRGESGSDVPCNGCTACCRASQFVLVEPDERDTLARIPPELLFPAPQLPRGHRVLGYDERGHCPMLVDDRCSIYEHRPRACRAYDCRVFAATGVELDEDPTKAEVVARVRSWRFRTGGEDDRARQDALRTAARYLQDHADELAIGRNPTALAGLAVELHEEFLDGAPDVERVRERLHPPA